MKISKQKPCLTRGQKGARSALPRVGLNHARPLGDPRTGAGPRSVDSPGKRAGMGTLIFPPREQTPVSYPGRRTLYHQRRPGRPEGLRRSLDRRPYGKVQTCAPGRRDSMRGRHTAGSRLAPVGSV